MEIILRRYTPADCTEILNLFYDTVHSVNAKDYTKEQLDAWADGKPDIERWNRTLLEHYSVVALADGDIAGFGDITESGYLDRLYVHKDFQSKGIASLICDELERRINASSFTTHASITAKSFFEHRGYRTIKKQQVERHGVMLTNFVMEKSIK